MHAGLPRFPVTTVGSWPRSQELLHAMKRRTPDLERLQDEAVVAALRAQEAAGADIVTDGEMSKVSFLGYVHGTMSALRRRWRSPKVTSSRSRHCATVSTRNSTAIPRSTTGR